MPAVQVDDVYKAFGTGESRVVALKGARFEAPSSEMVMIVGPSGCGKTTLLSVLAGTLAADSGNVTVFGEVLSRMKRSRVTEFRGSNIGFIFQQFNLIPTWTALENASVPLLLLGKRRKEAEQRAAALLEQMGLGNRLSAHPRQLSGGQQQRVAIARALVHEPRLVICDEPTASLDAASGKTVMELLKNTACRPDRCVIVVTHDSRIFGFADRIAEMEDGYVERVTLGSSLPESSNHYL
jgi:putative ABC transport system ATP-binding protein